MENHVSNVGGEKNFPCTLLGFVAGLTTKMTEPENTSNSQSNLEKKNHHNPRLEAILQSCSHHDSMVLAQKQTLRSIEQHREPRNGPTNICPTNL